MKLLTSSGYFLEPKCTLLVDHCSSFHIVFRVQIIDAQADLKELSQRYMPQITVSRVSQWGTLYKNRSTIGYYPSGERCVMGCVKEE